jgi:hypothetical protein
MGLFQCLRWIGTGIGLRRSVESIYGELEFHFSCEQARCVMATTSLILPERLSLPQLIEWNNQLWNPSNEAEIRIDFRNTRFFTPFAMLSIINQIEN